MPIFDVMRLTPTIIATVHLLLIPGALCAQFADTHIISGYGIGNISGQVLTDVDGDGTAEPLFSSATYWSMWYPVDDQLRSSYGRLIAPELGTTSCIDAGDLNDDGYPDAVVGGAQDGRIMWTQNTGGGGFQVNHLIDSLPFPVTTIRLVDLDGDADLDLVVASRSGGLVGTSINAGGGDLGPVMPVPGTFPNAIDFDVADLNSDGLLDLTVLYGDQPQNIAWCAGAGPGSFAAPQELSLGPIESNNVSTADVNGDGIPDLITLLSNTMHWFPGVGDGTFAFGIPVPTPNTFADFEVFDGDMDGDLDLFALRYFGCYVMRNDGAGNFELAQNIPTPVYRASFGDINGDGFVDLLITDNSPHRYTIYTSNGSLEFAEGVVNDNIVSATVLNLEDLDGDGDLDLMARTGSYGDYRFYSNDGQGEFTFEMQITATSLGQRTILVADMDGDGIKDLVMRELSPSGTYTDELSWQKNLGDFTFAPRSYIAINLYALSNLVVGDMDGDGDMDVISITNSQTARWYRNNGPAGFASSVLLHTASGGDALLRPFIVDVNNDGINDVLIRSGASASKRIHPLINQGSGSFVQQPPITLGMDPISMTVGDVDGDGDVDIICTRNISAGHKVALNDGNGNFTDGYTWTEPSTSTTLTLADIDMDEDLDLFYGGVFTPNNGDGTFAEPVYPDIWQPAMSATSTYAIGDIDDDGMQDLMVAAQNGHVLLYWMRNVLADNARIEGRVFLDLDEDGQRDLGEPNASWCGVELDPGPFHMLSTNVGRFIYHVDPGTYTLSPTMDTTMWRLTTDSMLTVTVAEFEHSIGNDIGIAPRSPVPGMSLSVNAGVAPCAGTAPFTISYANVGNTFQHTHIELEVDPSYTFVSSEPAPDSLSNDRYYWTFYNSAPFDVRNISMVMHNPPVEAMGEVAGLTAHMYRLDETGAYQDTISYTLRDTVDCAYDPNDKQVFPAGYGTYGAVDLSTPFLEYTIRFQNTGTAPAFDVTLIDSLSTMLATEGLQLLGYSHEPTEIRSGPDQVLQVRFNNIMLPDSGSDMLGSQGFVRFRIPVRQPAMHMASINNRAGIIFDSNPAIITNTVSTTLVDCSLWEVTIMATDSAALEATSGDTYQWHVDGEPIAGATDQYLIPGGPGWYTVQVRSPYGCEGTSDPYFTTSMYVPSMGHALFVHPNPAIDQARISIHPPLQQMARMQLFNVLGEEVSSRTLTAGAEQVTLERDGLKDGIYYVRIQTPEGTMYATTLVWE